MQKLVERNTYTPADIPHVCSNCDPVLKALKGRSGVPDLKTSSNNSDAALTGLVVPEQNLRVSVAKTTFVLNRRGKPLMPCSPQKARMLLNADKAKVVQLTPFTIQLKAATGEGVQPVTLGISSGYNHAGLSAVTEKQELYSSEVQLRTDIVKLNSERRQYRRSRRSRKTWHRKPRFLNRKKSEGWLVPSIQHKLDSHIKIINKVKQLLPVSNIRVQVAAFDIQKIKNPSISGVEYQQGDQLGFWNVREYVLYRDNHICRYCKGKSKDPVLNVHHIESRQTGSDRSGNLITLCKTCHGKYHKDEIELKVRPGRGFKAETFMSMVRWKFVDQLRKLGNTVSHTYGYITKSGRIAQGLPRSHINDAFVIAGGNGQQRSSDSYFIRQVRKCNRKLFKGARSHIKNTAPREVFGFKRWDKVLYAGKELFVKGRRVKGYFALSDIAGKLVKGSISHRKLLLLETAKTLLIERSRIPLHPAV